ncbi:carboxymuconolactone decarboxylase family protein [Paenibacillus sp. GP183]|uniref:carboxymuconolactone decarboxylase family protein n=1 Tax=Paenibacillus sp. GP183 TaxID=1882751 RepID=UPI0008970374|nr:carboxymuconolactone decarboxylase family protein [Paenibacillus sp. GP183]SEC29052.1 alkylhydroperoxidase AhpD family core domain-containing protein [Paenibacillus sp. GP183]
MEMRMNYYETNPEALQALLALEKFASSTGIDRNLYELIKIRASQINGCAFCIDMHAKDLLESGESLDRILLLTVWCEVPIYSEKERAAIELTECVTRLSESGVPKEVYDNVRAHFDEKQFVDLIMAINAINCWNRIGISTGMFPGCMIK